MKPAPPPGGTHVGGAATTAYSLLLSASASRSASSKAGSPGGAETQTRSNPAAIKGFAAACEMHTQARPFGRPPACAASCLAALGECTSAAAQQGRTRWDLGRSSIRPDACDKGLR